LIFLSFPALAGDQPLFADPATYWERAKETFGALVEMFVVFIGLAILFLGASAGRNRSRGNNGGGRKAKKKGGGPLGGFHATEAMLLDKHYENPASVWAARKVRDKFFRF